MTSTDQSSGMETARERALLRRISCPVQQEALRSWSGIRAARGHVSPGDISPTVFGGAMSRAMMVEAVSAPETGEMAFRHGYEGRDVEALLGRSKGDLFADTYSEIYRFAVEPFLFDALTSAEPKIQTFSTESDAGRLLIFSQLALPVGEGGGQSNAAFVVFDLARMHQAGQILSLSLHTPLRRMLTEQRRPGRLGTIQI